MLPSGLLVKWNRFAGVHQSYLTYGYAKDASYMEAVQANAELTQRYDDKVSACVHDGCVSAWLCNTMYASPASPYQAADEETLLQTKAVMKGHVRLQRDTKVSAVRQLHPTSPSAPARP